MPAWNTRGLRGSAFEELIDLTNNLYSKQGLAVVQKVPTPITPVAIENKNITQAYFEKKSTVDYIGVAQGIPICFDAKEPRQPHLPLRNIHEHQLEFMQNFRKQKGLSFLLVHFAEKNEMFLLPIEELARHCNIAANDGRKSIPYADFNHDFLVKNEGGFPVHYLVAVNAYLAI